MRVWLMLYPSIVKKMVASGLGSRFGKQDGLLKKKTCSSKKLRTSHVETQALNLQVILPGPGQYLCTQNLKNLVQ